MLFVCLGNICRSPLAQGLFEHHAAKAGLAHLFTADSAGTSGWHEGEPPHEGSIRVASQHGIDISRQKSRPVRISDRHEFDWFIAMDRSNMQNLIGEFSIPVERIRLMRDFDLPAAAGQDIPDPWGMPTSGFQEVFNILNHTTANFLRFLIEHNRTDGP